MTILSPIIERILAQPFEATVIIVCCIVFVLGIAWDGKPQ